MNQTSKIVVCGLAVVAALSIPLVASAGEAKDNGGGSGKVPVVTVETAEYKCYESPPLCNCMGAEKCKALASSERCKPGTYNFWEKENLGTCVWNGTK